MKKNAFILSLLLLATCCFSVLCSCDEEKPAGAAYMLRPHEEWPAEVSPEKCQKVFLAGTIDMGNSADWQAEVFEYFKSLDKDYVLFNPRQEHWDATREGEMDYQVNWELDHLEQADHIIMNILGSSQSPISLLEMGLFARSGKLVVACAKDYYRYDNVRITCQHYHVPLFDNVEDLLKECF